MTWPSDGGYPDHLIESWTSRDGKMLTVRPVRPDDETMEAAFVGALSQETSYRRLLSGRRPQPDEIARWTHIDYRREMALVAVEARDRIDRICGVVRYVCERSGEPAGDCGGDAAFAIVLADDWQHRGLGTKLMTALIAAARDAGVRRLVDITLATNASMLALARRMGFAVSRMPGDLTVSRLLLSLAPRADDAPGA